LRRGRGDPDHALTRDEYLEEQREARRKNRFGAVGKLEERPPGRGSVNFYDDGRP
jgi:hypothetical protein